jgi:hypothetical protein
MQRHENIDFLMGRVRMCHDTAHRRLNPKVASQVRFSQVRKDEKGILCDQTMEQARRPCQQSPEATKTESAHELYKEQMQRP